MTYDVNRVRADFPSLESGIAFFDGPGGSQVPRQVGDAMAHAITRATSNRGAITISEKSADQSVVGYRQAVADLLNCDPRGVVYGRSWTQLTYDFSKNLSRQWKAGDEIIVTRLDHDSNIRPWVQAAESRGATVRWAEIDKTTGELPTSAVTNLLSSKTKFVAVSGAGNTIGTRPDIDAIGKAVKASGALFLVDGVHLTPHFLIDFKAMPADFFGFSSYKLLGPHCGTIVADPALLESIESEKLLPATSVVPERFEFGTLPYEIMEGVTASIDYVAGLDASASGSRREKIVTSMRALAEYEEGIFEYLEGQLKAISGITLYGHAQKRTPTVYFNVKGYEGKDVHQALAAKKVNAPASNFYALEVSRSLGLGDAGAVRAGIAPYTIKEDVDRLVNGLKELLK
jgi:cysteine desulfurase family protein (TIGR01976 family)